MTERDTQTLARLAPVFEAHAVPEADRYFLFCVFDRLIDEDYDNETVSGVIERGLVGADTYEDLLQEHARGHRRNRTWFRSEAFEDAVPTQRGRSLMRDLAAVNPDWQDEEEV